MPTDALDDVKAAWATTKTALAKGFATTVSEDRPTTGNLATQPAGAATKQASDFITVQSLANFSIMSFAITGAWNGLQKLPWDFGGSHWVPFILCFAFGVVSVLASKPRGVGAWSGAIFIGFINLLVLYGAVVGLDQQAPNVADLVPGVGAS